ncbi:uncharacterized protein TNCT_439151 [Trichonephila clavata]|uniref:Uncharacterized protein n=1 Tax=Trichonephila clavata TaxID=2740835 RepID=A0A8X6FNC6_TRICU|nr:uncharacterized protein TNCT_439151 [Trichonephila clavata]
MNFLPSLEHLSLINLAISIHNSSEFIESKEKLRTPYGYLDLLPVKQLFRERLLKSIIPVRLREKLLGIILPILIDVEKWNAEKKKFGIRKHLDICLTSFGTVDKRETVKKFVRSEDQNVVERFALACHFWMTDDVLKIWNKASVDERIHIEMKLLHLNEEYHWMLGSLHETTEYQFEKMATTQCLKKWFDWLHDGGYPCRQHNFLDESLLTFFHTIPEPNLLRALPQEKLRQLMKIKFSELSGRAYFSCLDYDQKLSLFQQEPFIILHDYLKWPLQFKFLEMACQAWKYMTGKDFYKLLYIICEEKMAPLQSVCFDFDYEDLLHEFWKESPHHFKISAKEHYDNHRRDLMDYSLLVGSYQMDEQEESPLQRLLDNYPGPADQ